MKRHRLIMKSLIKATFPSIILDADLYKISHPVISNCPVYNSNKPDLNFLVKGANKQNKII